jgi:hypothetical protein
MSNPTKSPSSIVTPSCPWFLTPALPGAPVPVIEWPFSLILMPSAPTTSPSPGQSTRSAVRTVSLVTTSPQPTACCAEAPAGSMARASAATTSTFHK